MERLLVKTMVLNDGLLREFVYKPPQVYPTWFTELINLGAVTVINTADVTGKIIDSYIEISRVTIINRNGYDYLVDRGNKLTAHIGDIIAKSPDGSISVYPSIYYCKKSNDLLKNQ